jgi:cell division protein FtsB
MTEFKPVGEIDLKQESFRSRHRALWLALFTVSIAAAAGFTFLAINNLRGEVQSLVDKINNLHSEVQSLEDKKSELKSNIAMLQEQANLQAQTNVDTLNIVTGTLEPLYIKLSASQSPEAGELRRAIDDVLPQLKAVASKIPEITKLARLPSQESPTPSSSSTPNTKGNGIVQFLVPSSEGAKLSELEAFMRSKGYSIEQGRKDVKKPVSQTEIRYYHYPDDVNAATAIMKLLQDRFKIEDARISYVIDPDQPQGNFQIAIAPGALK